MEISTTFEIVNSFLNEFLKNNISLFKKSEIEQQLYYFSKNKKYSSLFPAFTSLDEILDVYVKCGYLYKFDISCEPHYVINTNFKNYANFDTNNIIKIYCEIKKNLCFSYTNLKYFLSDPNRNYFLIDGKEDFEGSIHGKKWIIRTDGITNKMDFKLVKGNKKSFISPFDNCNHKFEQVDFEIVNVSAASYVLYQEIYKEYIHNIISYRVNSSILYTELIDEEKINKIIKTHSIRKI